MGMPPKVSYNVTVRLIKDFLDAKQGKVLTARYEDGRYLAKTSDVLNNKSDGTYMQLWPGCFELI